MEASGTDIQKADSIFSVLQTKYPTHESSAQAGFERAILKYNTGDTLSAVEMYKGVAAAFDSLEYGLQSRYFVAKYYRSKEWNDSARTEFKLLAVQEYNLLLAAEAQYRLGEMYMREKNLDSAIVELEILKEKFAGYEDWYSYGLLALGECYENTEAYQKAEEIYTVLKEIRIDDDFAKTAEQRLKRIAKMIENLKKEEE
jgi:tetratricopeptide (TPR) repeat protein